MTFLAQFKALRVELHASLGQLQGRPRGPSKYEDPQGALSKLVQLATVERYQALVADTSPRLEANKVVGGDDLESSCLVTQTSNLESTDVAKVLNWVQQLINIESIYDNDAQDQVGELEMKVLVDGKQDEAKVVKLVVVAVEQNIDKPDVEEARRGNLAMEMSMHYGIKVRVIQGFKYEGSASRTVYVYDRLYKIVEAQFDVGKSGFGVFKFKLVRMENQVEMGSAVLKFANTLTTRSLEARLSGACNTCGNATNSQVIHIKFNCDATWHKESGKVGMSFVARYCNGEVLLSRTRSDIYAKSPLETEAKAVWWAIKHAQSRGYFKAVFESDSLTLVHALRNQSIPLQIATLFFDILSNSLAFGTCDWSFVKGERNMIAYSIETWALRCINDVVFE
nr:histone-lysine N-methyltransferase family member SUVH9-like [Tanacetum cinerariifolium]